jgi:hypothetical protein
MAVGHAPNLPLSDATTADGTRALLFHLYVYMNCLRAGRGPQLAMISLLTDYFSVDIWLICKCTVHMVVITVPRIWEHPYQQQVTPQVFLHLVWRPI